MAGASEKTRASRGGSRVRICFSIARSERRRLAPLDWNSKHISDATLGLDHSRRARVAFELAPEAKDLHVDTAVEDIFMDASRLQQMLAAERTLRRLEKGEQHRILALGQCDRGSGRVGQLAGLAVELPAGKAKAAALGIARRRCASDVEPPQYRADAGEQLTQVEWLGPIIVGAELEPNHPIDFVKAVAGDDDDRHLRAPPDPP